MAKVLLKCAENSVYFVEKWISLPIDSSVRLGRKTPQEETFPSNGLFECSNNVSSNHALIAYVDSKFYIKAVSTRNTYLNGAIVPKTELTEVHSNDLIALGRKTKHSVCKPVIFQLQLFRPDDPQLHYRELLRKEFPVPLFFTKDPPHLEWSLEELYACTWQRFSVLKSLNEVGDITNFELLDSAMEMLSNDHPSVFEMITQTCTSCQEEYQALTRDYISNFILRIATCRQYQVRSWFIYQETKLLYLRWYCLSKAEKRDVLKFYDVDFPQVSSKDLNCPEFLKGSELLFFKVPFSLASKFIRNRQVLVRDGFVFLDYSDVGTVIVNKYRQTLLNSLLTIKKNLNKIWWEHRLLSIVKYVEEQVCFERFVFTPIGCNKSIRSEDIEALLPSFPLCMNILHHHLKVDSHLRNGGRFQYMLFLKGIGMSLSDALMFWRSHFTRKIDSQQFVKKYSYHVRHVYGTVGKRADYPPQHCNDIMKARPGPLEYHGCPFKVLDRTRILGNLARNNIQPIDADNLTELMSNSTAQLTCKRYFELTHNMPYPSDIVSHPNVYYNHSRQSLLDKDKKPSELQIQNKDSLCCGNRSDLDW